MIYVFNRSNEVIHIMADLSTMHNDVLTEQLNGEYSYEFTVALKDVEANKLEEFNKRLLNKPMVIVANKMDLKNAKNNLEEFKKKVPDKKIFEVTAQTNSGLTEVIDYLSNLLDSLEEENLYDDDAFESHVLYKFKEEKPFTIEKDGKDFVVKGEKIEKLFKMTKFTDEGIARFSKKLRQMGIDDELEKMGAESGDMVKILDFYFEYHK